MAKVVKIIHADAGHAWVAVKLAELKVLGIQSSISGYSYVRGKTAYLEEDCDAGLYIQAMRARGIEVAFREGSRRERSPIRGFDRYTPAAV
jgi:hypothetical protein